MLKQLKIDLLNDEMTTDEIYEFASKIQTEYEGNSLTVKKLDDEVGKVLFLEFFIFVFGSFMGCCGYYVYKVYGASQNGQALEANQNQDPYLQVQRASVVQRSSEAHTARGNHFAIPQTTTRADDFNQPFDRRVGDSGEKIKGAMTKATSDVGLFSKEAKEVALNSSKQRDNIVIASLEVEK